MEVKDSSFFVCEKVNVSCRRELYFVFFFFGVLYTTETLNEKQVNKVTGCFVKLYYIVIKPVLMCVS